MGGGGATKPIVYRFDCMCYAVYINTIYKMVHLYFIHFIVFVVYFWYIKKYYNQLLAQEAQKGLIKVK